MRGAPLSRIAYVNGRYCPHAQAQIHVEDRGYQFADGIYEVLYLLNGHPIDRDLHLDRLDRSLRELRIRPPLSRPALLAILTEIVARNRRTHGLIYIQITRGVAKREHPFPPPNTRPSLVVTLRAAPKLPTNLDAWAAHAITLPDQRWARCDIKSIALLPNILARQTAHEHNAAEAILFDSNNIVTEGASTSVWIVDSTGTLRTRALSPAILPGCTRAALIQTLAAASIPFEPRAFSTTDLTTAREIFLTSATSFIKPIVLVDGTPVSNGKPGPITRQLFDLFAASLRKQAVLF